MTPRRHAIRTLIAAAAAFAALIAIAPTSWAESVPFTDPNATGAIGFCDKSGNEVSSGSLTDRPFVWTAVSSTPAPAGYAPTNRGKASLFAFQPRQDVDPGEWIGSELTAGSLFTSTAHPMAQGTTLDPSMGDTVTAFPANWQGYFELRMFFGAPNKQQVTRSYPAAIIKISGSTWTLMDGGDVACDAGKAVSAEQILLPSSTFVDTPTASQSPSSTDATQSGLVGTAGAATAGSGNSHVPGATSVSHSSSTAASVSRGGSAHPSSSAGNPVVPNGSDTSASGSDPNLAARTTSPAGILATAAPKSSSSSTGLLVLAAITVLAIVGGGVTWWARQRKL